MQDYKDWFRLLVLISLVCCVGFNESEVYAQPPSKPQWPGFAYDRANTGQSPYKGPQTNKLKWRFSLPSWGSCVAIGGDGIAYVGTNSGSLFALNKDGAERWRFQLPRVRVTLPPDMPETEKREVAGLAISINDVAIGPDGTIYFGEALHIWEGSSTAGFSASGYKRKLYALNPDRTVKWKFTVGEEDIATHISVGADGAIYFGTVKGKYQQAECSFYAVNPNGTKKWKRLLSASGTILSAAVADDGTIYVGGDKLRALNPTDGAIRWEYDIQTTSSIAAAPAVGQDGTIYVCTPPWPKENHHKLFAINPDGTKKWELIVGAMETSPAIAKDGTIYITSWVTDDVQTEPGIKTGLTAITPDGRVKWSFETRFPDWHFSPEQRGIPWGSDSSPIIGADGVIYFGSDTGLFYAVNPDGTLKWKFGIGGEFDNCPSIDAEGTLYICHSGGPGEIHGGPLRCYAISDDGTIALPTPRPESSREARIRRLKEALERAEREGNQLEVKEIQGLLKRLQAGAERDDDAKETPAERIKALKEELRRAREEGNEQEIREILELLEKLERRRSQTNDSPRGKEGEITAVQTSAHAAKESFAMTVAAANVRPYPAKGSPIARLRIEGIRAMSSSDPTDADQMAAVGFNLVLPWERILRDAKKTTSPDSPIILKPEDFSERAVEHLRSWARKCAENDLIMMYMMYVADEESVRYLSGDLLDHLRRDGVTSAWPTHQYRHVVDWDGNAARYAPCPLERRYWMGFILPQLELVARVLRETGATGGGALELETYCWGSIYPGYSSQKKTFCYCNYCFAGFVKSLGREETPVGVPAGRRFDWLTQRGLLPRYETYLEESMTNLIGEMIHEVRKVNPSFLFGLYPYCPFWYYDALIRGSGTPELPCLIFPGPEYSGGYLADASIITDFFGAAPTPASVAHLRRRKLSALYAGGLWAGPKGGMSREATAMAMDRMLRGPDGYWIYKDVPNDEVLQPFWKRFATINRWTTDHPGPLAAGDVVRNAIPDAIKWVRQNKPDGVVVSEGRIVARYDGQAGEVRLLGGDFDSDRAVAEGWQGRGSLPPLDEYVYHSGRASILFAPSATSEGPRSPYIDLKVTEAKQDTTYELSFWVKTADTDEPIRFWVGRANSSQYPHYMYYANYFLPAGHDWMRLRIPFELDRWPLKGGSLPAVLRFWCPPTDGKLWLDEVRLRPVVARTIDVPLNPPAEAAGWGTVDWELSPSDARCEASIVDPEDNHKLRMRLYPGDSLAPLAALTGLKPVRLRLKLYPSAAEPVTVEKLQVRFMAKPR